LLSRLGIDLAGSDWEKVLGSVPGMDSFASKSGEEPMSKVYVLEDGGVTRAMPQIRCKDEDRELQMLLEKNYDLLPGEQIDPEEPRRWLLLKREMPVPDPGSGENRWSIDFFFVDQGGIPTFVECKRFEDTRSRREVVGQMLDYAANGHYYWTSDTIRDLAIKQSLLANSSLDETIRTVEPETGDSVDDFLELVENNLREGQIRLIFFLEEAPHQLRSIVDFLNKQMERTEVLIVEAKQYDKEGVRIIVPRLFGYTEEARRIKKTVTVVSGGRRTWNETDFLEDAKERLTASESEAVKRLLNFVRSKGYEIKWGSGKETGSFNVVASNLFPKSVIGVSSDGKLWLNFGALEGNDLSESFRDAFAEAVKQKLAVSLPSDLSRKYPSVDIKIWGPKVEDFINLFSELVSQYETDND